jgi:hypothetical protein
MDRIHCVADAFLSAGFNVCSGSAGECETASGVRDTASPVSNVGAWVYWAGWTRRDRLTRTAIMHGHNPRPSAVADGCSSSDHCGGPRRRPPHRRAHDYPSPRTPGPPDSNTVAPRTPVAMAVRAGSPGPAFRVHLTDATELKMNTSRNTEIDGESHPTRGVGNQLGCL